MLTVTDDFPFSTAMARTVDGQVHKVHEIPFENYRDAKRNFVLRSRGN